MRRLLDSLQIRILLITLLLLGMVLPIPLTNTVAASNGKIIYVKQNAAGDGTSWDNALGDLHTALVQAQSGDQVWIAAGTYVPTGNQMGNDPRTQHFKMKNGVRIYGGFPADASNKTGMSSRDWETHRTILSGVRDTDHVYHVFFNKFDETSKLDTTAVLDGVTITGGKADGPGWFDNFQNHDEGAGMFNEYSSPLLRNVVFTNNESNHGGALYMNVSSPILQNVTITGNTSTNGGGIYIAGNTSKLLLLNVWIKDNKGGFGGGIYSTIRADVTIINSVISGNIAYDGGGIANYSNGKLNIINTAIHGNSSDLGGAIYNDLDGTISLTNVTLSGNFADSEAGAISNRGGNVMINNSVIWGNHAFKKEGAIYSILTSQPEKLTFTYSLIEGSGGSGTEWINAMGIDGGNNIDANPQFIDYRAVTSYDQPTSEGDYRLSYGSPAMDVGSNHAYHDGTNNQVILLAVDGEQRVTFLDAQGEHHFMLPNTGKEQRVIVLHAVGERRIVDSIIDMGAYEYAPQSIVTTLPTVEVPITVISAPAGVAFTTLLYDPSQLYVGTFANFNSNGITGYLTGLRVDEDGIADVNGKFTKLQGVLDGTANGKLVEVQLPANGPSLYVRLIATPATNGQFDVQKIKP